VKIGCWIAALVLFASIAFARIGETEAQTEARYGKSTSGSRPTKAYFHKDFFIIVTFDNGASAIETYEKRNGSPMSTVEIRTLLDANGGGTKWHQPIRNGFEFYYHECTRFAEFNAVTNTLTVAQPEALKRIAARGHALQAQKMQGF
jgi:hypothetical protein